MRAPLSWIREFTPVDAPVDELVAALNQLGLEVEAVEEPGREVLGVRVARILDVLPHPDADQLQLADVDFGDGTTRRRVRRAEHRTRACSCRSRPRARSCPAASTLERRKIRGQVSDGMLCSPTRARARRRPRGDPRARRRRRARRPTSASCSASTTSSSTSRSRRTAPTRCASSASRASSRRTSGSRSRFPSPTCGSTRGVDRRQRASIEAPDRCPRYLAGRRTGHDGGVARVDAAAAREGGHAADQQRRRRDELRAARAQPAAARVRPRPPRRAGGSSCAWPTPGERMTTLDGVERVLDDGRSADLRRRAGRRRRSPGSWVARPRRCPRDHDRDPARSRRTSSAWGSRGASKRLKLRSESSARFERGIDPDGVADARGPGDGAARARSPVRGVAPEAVDEYPPPHERPRIHAADEPR